MAVNFIHRERSAFDEGSGISILLPRVLPSDPPEPGASIEYQYTFTRKGERVGALGLFGDQRVDGTSNRAVWTYTVNLSPPWVLRDILQMKSLFGSIEPDFTFMQSIARGLVAAFAGQTTNTVDLRYVALASSESLIGEGLSDIQISGVPNEGEVILAEVFVPAHIL